LSARFFVIKLKEGNFHSVSPFLIHKSLVSAVGEVKSVKKLRSGVLLVEVINTIQAKGIINCTSFGHLSVTVIAHETLIFSRGLITEQDILYISENEILENLKDQNVCAVRRINIRREGKVLPTKHLILTFSLPSIPKHIHAGYLRCPVRHYIPNPLRCFQCQRFGHSKLSCRGSVTCARCSEVGHDSDNCNAAPCCVSCGGTHPSFSRVCPSWQAEKEIQILKTERSLSYLEARKLIQSRTPKPGLSYSSAAVTKSVKTIATQTDPPTKTTKNEPDKLKYYSIKPNLIPVNKVKKSGKLVKDNTSINTESTKKKHPKKQTSKGSQAINNENPFKNSAGKILTFKDFLKNPPTKTNEIEDSLKVYVSSEEDMLTDSPSDSEVVFSTSACS
jgi:hypothetical protein